MKILVVERRDSGHFLVPQLLDNYGIEFTWQRVSSERDLRGIALEFNPAVVLCGDDLPNPQETAMDILRLLSRGMPTILVCEVGDGNAPWATPGAATPVAVASAKPLKRTHFCPPTHGRNFFPAVLRTSTDSVVMTDADGFITYANPAACRALASSESALGTALRVADLPALRMPHWFDVADDSATGRRHASLAHPADGLVLFGAAACPAVRVHLNDLINHATALPGDRQAALPLVGLDLTGLPLMNEAYGSELGDAVLELIGMIVQPRYARCGMVARLDDDEFLVVLPRASNPADAAVAVQLAREPTPVPAAPVSPSEIPVLTPWVDRPAPAAVPAAAAAAPAAPSAPAAPARVVPRAVPVLREAVRSLGKSVSRFEADLNDAIRRNAISVHYQPQFDLQSGRGCGAEALARWFLASGESLSPRVFIPLAERSGMIASLGTSVLESSCRAAAAWRGRDAEALTLTINVSAQQIGDRYCQELARVLKISGFPALRLELEIDESALIEHADLTIKCIRQWKELGVRIAVNHLGTDYSRLSYLSRVSVDRLKLDTALIRQLSENEKSAAVVHALVSLGQEMGVEVMAVGVETDLQFQVLRDLGCRQAQGYFFGRPMSAVQAQVALRKEWGNAPRSALRPGPEGARLN